MHGLWPGQQEHGSCLTVPAVAGLTGSIVIMTLTLQGWLQASRSYQISHFVTWTDVLYPDLWVNESSPLGGLWLPTVWVRQRSVSINYDPRYLQRALQVQWLWMCHFDQNLLAQAVLCMLVDHSCALCGAPASPVWLVLQC